jgi:hypothetical protein
MAGSKPSTSAVVENVNVPPYFGVSVDEVGADVGVVFAGAVDDGGADAVVVALPGAQEISSRSSDITEVRETAAVREHQRILLFINLLLFKSAFRSRTPILQLVEKSK